MYQLKSAGVYANLTWPVSRDFRPYACTIAGVYDSMCVWILGPYTDSVAHFFFALAAACTIKICGHAK
jgi:hypothetical protein